MSNNILLPRILQIGAGASLEVASILNHLGGQRPLLVTDRMMVELGYAARIQQQLSKSAIPHEVFSDTVAEPTESSISVAVDRVREGGFDSLIALGGGSAIDSAKAISILAKYGGTMMDYKFPRQVMEPGLPIIAIPTTAGTGSETTRVTIITDEKTDEKMLCTGLGFLPTAALVDYELTLSLPPRITADTGIDALVHAVEAYVSRKANSYADSQALSAMRLIGPNLRTAYHDGDNRPAREAMMLGSTLAGIAFSNASVALVHGMSRPIGAHFHVPHGLSNAMLMPAVTEYSIPGAPERYADCARAMGVAAVDDSTELANQKLLEELRSLNDDLQVPTPTQYGIDPKQFMELRELMATQALASGSPGNNPRVPSKDEIMVLYQQILN